MTQVKAWMAALKKEFPGASKQLVGVDRAEGTAEFAGMLSNALGKLGCDADPRALKAQLLQELDDRMLPVPAPVDSQAYLLGSAAGLLMDEMGERNWKEKVMAGKTPIEVLLASEEIKNLPAAEPQADPLLERSVSITSELHGCMQGETDRAIGKMLAHPQDYVLVQMEKTAFKANGFFSVNTPEGPVDATPQGSSTTGEKLNFLGAPMVLMDGICGGGQNKYVLVPRASVGSRGQIETNADEIPYYKGSIPPISSSDEDWNNVQVVCRY
jgi:hypothetical protein